MVTTRGGLELTEDEAFALLGMCMTSPQVLDSVSETALRKLAEFCIHRCDSSSSVPLASGLRQTVCPLEVAGG